MAKLTPTGEREDIDLQNAEYSDDDEDMYFKEKDLIDYLFKIEDENLFNVNLCQNDEEQLEEAKKKSE